MKRLLPVLTAFSLLLLLPLAFSVQAAPARIALVVGNGDYEHAPLKNPANDAALMTTTLKSAGFEVMSHMNLDRRELKRAFLRFGDRVKETGTDTVSLVYYAGHGAQVNGENYLIPIDSQIEDELDVDIEGIRASSLLNILEDANAALNIVILDACRNNPFKSSSRSAHRGLAKMDAPTGTLLAYSTAPGQVAEDGIGSNSTYTKALSLAMRRPGATVEQVFKRVRIEVMSRTSDEQVPWESSSLTGDFYFSGGATPAPVATAPAIQPAPQVNLEAMFWESIQGSEDADDYQAYLTQYPIGSFVALARVKVKKLGRIEAKRVAKLEEGRLLAPAPAPKLVSSKQVFRSQEALQVLGLYSGKLDGLAGSGTANSIKEWQQRNGLPKTGEVTELQLAKLENEALAHLRKNKSKPISVASVKDIKSVKFAGIEFGRYHALVIGIDDYKHLPKLKTAVNDAEAVADVLKSEYGFNVNLLRNANRSEIMAALDDYESNLGVNDNLLIYYAGHGDVDKVGGEGYWHPADARKGKRGSWISNSGISTRLRALDARHVIVVADSCYYGTLFRSGGVSVDNRSKDVRSLNLKRSRGALTSGGCEPVVNHVGGNNSPFAKAFIDALNDNKDVVDMSTMAPEIRRSVMLSAPQIPRYSAIRKTGDEGGDFFFVRKN